MLLVAGGVRADAIVNGGFETGDLTGWQTATFGGPGGAGAVTTLAPYAGIYCVHLWASDYGTTELYQTFHANKGDVLSFEYEGDGLAGESNFEVWIGSSTYGGYDIFNGNGFTMLGSLWSEATWTSPAAGDYSLVFLAGEGGPSGCMDVYLDTVQLVPEPASMGLLAVALTALIARRRGNPGRGNPGQWKPGTVTYYLETRDGNPGQLPII